MDQTIASEANSEIGSDSLIPASSIAEVNNFLAKINDKLKQLKTIGLTKNDHDTLRLRLSLVWGNPKVADLYDSDPHKLKIWRHSRARQIYAEIQDKSSHVFLAVISTISPSGSIQKSFQDVVDYLVQLGNYEPYRLNLTSEDKIFFESTSVEQGFTGSRQYLDFIGTMFPQGEERVIQYAYSYVPFRHFPAFLKAMEEGIYKSQLYTNENTQKAKDSSCASILIPGADQDGGCTLVVDRKMLMDAIFKFGLSELKLE